MHSINLAQKKIFLLVVKKKQLQVCITLAHSNH